MPDPNVKVQQVYLCTVQLVVKADTQAEAEDAVSVALNTDLITDWSHLKIGGQYLYPTKRYVPEPYTEGDFIDGHNT